MSHEPPKPFGDPKSRPEWLSPEQLVHSAESHVANWLEKSGYTVNHARLAGTLEIEAERAGIQILVRVKYGVYPSTPKALKQEEVDKLKANSAALGRRPYAAKVVIGPDGFLLKHIEWQNVP